MGSWRAKHKVPRFAANGKEIETPAVLARCSSTLVGDAANVKIPPHWQAKDLLNQRRTLSFLRENRKAADRPDLSYDLDGDGHVSPQDYFLAKRFDQDRDGKLNEQELSAAKKAISQGYKDQFLFGLDCCAPVPREMQPRNRDGRKTTHLRAIQKNGKILVAEDFTPLAPARTASAIGGRTQAALMAERRQQSVSHLMNAYGDL